MLKVTVKLALHGIIPHNFGGIFETSTVTGISVAEGTVPVPELLNYNIIKYSFICTTMLR
jgi:hypothetical protein